MLIYVNIHTYLDILRFNKDFEGFDIANVSVWNYKERNH